MSLVIGEDCLSNNLFAVAEATGIRLTIDYYDKVLSMILPYEDVDKVVAGLLGLKQKGAKSKTTSSSTIQINYGKPITYDN